jgi:hypothetical protein
MIIKADVFNFVVVLQELATSKVNLGFCIRLVLILSYLKLLIFNKGNNAMRTWHHCKLH